MGQLALMRTQAIQAPSGAISARMVLRVVEFCRVRGHDADLMCRSVGVTHDSLAEPDARVPYDTALRLGQRALEITGDDNFGLHLAADVRDTRNFDAGMLLLMASPTIRVALERMALHQRYWGDGDRATLRRVNNGLAIRYTLRGTAGAGTRVTRTNAQWRRCAGRAHALGPSAGAAFGTLPSRVSADESRASGALRLPAGVRCCPYRGRVRRLELPLYSLLIAWVFERSNRSMAVAIAFHAGAHLDHIERAPRSDLRLHALHLVVLAVIAVFAARSLATSELERG